MRRVVAVWLMIIFCSKFYYLWGFNSGNAPAAPIYLVYVRDLIVWSFMLFALYTLGFPVEKKFRTTVVAVILGGFFIAAVHLVTVKPMLHWTQHYVRNMLLPMFFLFIGYQIYHKKIIRDPQQILTIPLFASVAISLWQIFFAPELMFDFTRPTGLMGDPIINSIFILLGWLLWAPQNYFVSILGTLISFFVLGYASALSALLSIMCALLIAGPFWFIAQMRKGFSFKLLLRSLVVVGAAILGIILPSVKGFNLTDNSSAEFVMLKAHKMESSINCYGKSDCDQAKVHGSLARRIENNLLPFSVCSQEKEFCLFGDVTRASLWRVDSTWASLTLNAGWVFAGLIYFLIIGLFLKVVKNIILDSNRIRYYFGWVIIFLTGGAYSFLNSITYKYPFNVLFYISLGALCSILNSSFKNREVKKI